MKTLSKAMLVGGTVLAIAVTGSGTTLRFDGTTGYIQAGNVNLANSSFTIEAWARRMSANSMDFIVGQGSGSANVGLHFGFHYAGTFVNKFVFAFWADDLASPNVYTDSEWHHWAGTYNATTKARCLYCDGVLIASDTASANYQGTGLLYIGVLPMTSGTCFDGSIDEVRVWNVARSATDIAALWNSRLAGNEPGLIAYYPMEEGTGTTTVDATGHGYTGALIGGFTWNPGEETVAPWAHTALAASVTATGALLNGWVTTNGAPTTNYFQWWSSGLTNQSPPQTVSGTNSVLNLDGIDDYVQVPAGVWFNGDFTAEFKAFLRRYTNYGRFLEFANGPGVDDVIISLTGGTEGRLGVWSYTSSRSAVGSPEPVPLNQWVDLAVTLQGSQASLYLNGVLWARGTLNIPANVVRNYNYLGKPLWPSETYGDTLMDDVRLWSVARTAAQIRADLTQPPDPADPTLLLHYQFDETSGTTVLDSRTTNPQNGTLYNGASRLSSVPVLAALTNLAPATVYNFRALADAGHGTSAGAVGQLATLAPGAGTALQFNGVNGFARVADFARRIPTNEITLEFWQRLHRIKNGSPVSVDPDNGNNRCLVSFGATGPVYWDFGDIAGDGRLSYVPAPGVDTWIGTWQHFAFVAKAGPSGSMQIYRNGVLEASKLRGGSPCFTGGDLKLGMLGSLATDFMDGDLDDFRIWNRARSGDEIQQAMNQRLTGNEPGLVLCYHMDEGAGGILVDATTNASYGLLFNGPLYVPSTAPVGLPVAVTLPAANVAYGSATLSGTVKGDGSLPVGAWFEYWTNVLPVLGSESNQLALFKLTTPVTSLDSVNWGVPPDALLSFTTINAATPADIWPGGLANYFAARYTGRIYLPNPGSYTFSSSSDDGSRLFIDGQQVLDNNGVHGAAEVSGSINLAAGHHWLEVRYFQYNYAGSLVVSYAGPGIPKQIIPADAFLRRDPDPLSVVRLPIQNLATNPAVVVLTTNLSGLLSDTLYYYRLVATNAIGTSYGADQTFSMYHPAALTGLYFDGIDDYVITPNLTNAFTNETVTLEVWFDALKPGVIVDERSVDEAWRDSQIEIVQTSNPLRGEIHVRVWSNTPPNTSYITVGQVDFGTWNHVALRYDKATLTLAGFLNGMKTSVATNWDRLAPWESKAANGIVYDLGRQDSTAMGSGAWFNGMMDEFRVWNVARSDAEIANNYTRRLTGLEPGLVVYYCFNEASGTTALNSASTGPIYNGTLVNGPTYIASGAGLFQPIVTTLAATPVLSTTATLWGSVSPGGASGDCYVWFEYGTSLNFGSGNANHPAIIHGGLAPQTVSLAVTNLESGSRYYFRAVAQNQYGTSYGDALTMDTLVVGNGYPISTRAGSGQSTTAPRHITDSQGNIYLAGLFAGTVSFKDTLQAAGSGTNAFLAKLARGGDWRWDVNIPVTNGQAQIKALALENDTTVLAAGSFSGTVTLGTANLTATNGTQAFLARFDPAATNWTWAIALGTGPTNTANAVAVGSDGRIYVAGQISGNNNLGTNAYGTNVILNIPNGSDAFVACFTHDGQPVWATQGGGTGATDHDAATALVLGSYGEVYVTGLFRGQGRFGPYSVTSTGGADVFFAALNATNGLVQQVLRAGGAGEDRGTALAMDLAGNLYLVAQLFGAADFSGAPLPELDSVGMNLVVFRLNRQLGQWTLSRRAAARAAYADSIAAAPSGCVYLAGDFTGIMRYGPTLITVGTGTNASSDVFLAQLVAGPGDALDWTDFKQIGGIGMETRGSVSVDPAGSLVVSGTYAQTLHLGYVEISTPNPQEIFVARLYSDGTYEHNRWEIGQALTPPDEALASVPDNRAKGLVSIDVLAAPPGLEDSDGGNSFLWNDEQKRLYAVRPVTAMIKWRLDEDSTNLANVATMVGRCFWPDHAQTNVAGVPVEVQGPGVGRGYFCAGIPFNTNGASVMPVTRGSDQFQIFQTATNASGYNVIHYTTGLGAGASTLEVVYTRPYTNGSAVETLPVDAGTALFRAQHQDSTGKNGYALFARSFYDGTAYDRSSRTGPILPVNRNLQNDPYRELVVVWYRTNAVTGVAWGCDPVRYTVRWPDDAPTLVIASGQGAPVIVPQAQVYHQPDPNLAGFNPNEEHALIVNGQLYALRCDLNDVISPKASEPYVLLKYPDPDATNSWRMQVYHVVAEDDYHTFANYTNAVAGDVAGVPLPAPLDSLALCGSSNRIAYGQAQAHQAWTGTIYAKSAGYLQIQYWYPTRDDFYFGPTNPPAGTCVPWMSEYAQASVTPGATHVLGEPVLVGYQVTWPADVPTLDVGQTLTTPAGGLPDLLHFASGRLIYDDGNHDGTNSAGSLVRMFDPLSERTIQLSNTFRLPSTIATGTDSSSGRLVFTDLPYPLRIRLFYDNLNQRLSFGGWYEADFGLGDPLLLPNILTPRERDRITQLADTTTDQSLRSAFTNAIGRLYDLTRNPNQVDMDRDGKPDKELRAGLITQIRDGYNEILIGPVILGPTNSVKYTTNILGQPVSARVTNVVQEQFIDEHAPKALTAGLRYGSGYVTVIENDYQPLRGTIALHIIYVTNSLYRGNLQVLPPVTKNDNPFDQRLTLHHSGDFGGEPQNYEFEWYYQPDQNGVSPPFPVVVGGVTNWNGWIRFDTPPSGTSNGVNNLTLGEGNTLSSLLVLCDNWVVCRYRGFTDSGPTPWSDWVGAPGGDGAMLAEGWIKRVLAGLNLFDSRVTDFHKDAPATYASMILQAGPRYEGPVAFNPDPSYLNSLGLIQAYETVLDRGRQLSIDGSPPVNFGPANNALLLAAGRIADLYMLLGNEAYADASDPTIGFTTSSAEYGSLAPSIFCFQNQVDSLLSEELALLRGRDDSTMSVKAPPLYNRLIWNFTQGEGEVAYKLTYNISDQDHNGFIDEKDAMKLYPQGHGDAWGHYLTAIMKYYTLLRHPYYEWVPRPESVTVAGAPVLVDYLDERKFAQAASAKAKTGAEIVNLTYRQSYVENPAGQWQGYQDTQTNRAWGVSEWATRAGLGAYFDWVAANAILPATDPDTNHVGIQKIDRTTVPELADIASQFAAIESQLDTVDRGLNPLGLAVGAMPFDIDPSKVALGQTHFDQIYQRALKAMSNTVALFDYVNTLSQGLRRNQDDVDKFTTNVRDQERDYKNRMIEIFGYPYAGDIGPAGTYPSGYDGPDIYHYMYVNASDLTGDQTQPDKLITGYYKPLEFPDVGFVTKKMFFPADVEGLTEPILSGDGTLHVDFPMVSDGAYQFAAPSAWGMRRAPGKIQNALAEMLKARAKLNQGLIAYDNLRRQIADELDGLKALADLDTFKVLTRTREVGTIVALSVYEVFTKKAEETVGQAADKTKDATDAAVEGVPKSVGLSSDAFSGLRATIKTIGNVACAGLKVVKAAMGLAEQEADATKLVLESQTELAIEGATATYEIGERKKAIEQLCREEIVKRVELYTLQEDVNQAFGAYLSVLAEGQRLEDERYNFRIKTAAAVEDYRYQDMAFRIFQNDALQKYRAQFDLAARYVYLAAKAYDYETCLLNTDTGAGSKLLTEIVQQRALGQLVNGLPVAGRNGLADPLARLGQNFEVYRGQLGFTTPETETGRFSLRSELFRVRPGDLQTNVLNGIVSTNQNWPAVLQACRVADLWQIPEFRRFCRPFAPEAAGPQPGLVIPIPTTITFGLNYFGWPLGPGDSAYDSSRFATKVRSAGVWFSDYNLAGLSMTPRVYLVPIGTDILRSPSGNELQTREFNVVDQKLPVPFPIGASDLSNPDWIPVNDSLSDTFGDIRRFSTFRAYHDKGYFDENEATQDTRLIGRSVWNSRWMLIIPGGTFLYDPNRGLDTFIATVGDIKIFFQTYAYSGD